MFSESVQVSSYVAAAAKLRADLDLLNDELLLINEQEDIFG